MRLKDYLKGRASVILINIISLITLVLFLFSIGNDFHNIRIIVITWFTVLILFFTYEYKRRKNYFDEISRLTDNIDKKYLISEIIELPPYIDAQTIKNI